MVVWLQRDYSISIISICTSGIALCMLAVLYLAGLIHSTCEYPCIYSRGRQMSSRSHKLAVLVPFRDRFEELQEFTIHLNRFLAEQGVQHRIFIISQVDGFRFNRASLLNVGFLESGDEYDYVALHDVDLLPTTQELHYSYPSAGPLHLAAPHLHPRYHYPTFIGGVLLLTRSQFRAVNGLSNLYWGWGLEDDELYARLREAQLPVMRPGNLTTGLQTFRHIHDRRVRRRDEVHCHDQRVLTRRRDRRTGLDTVRYALVASRQLTIDGAAVSVLSVALECSRTLTPWCDCSSSVGNSPKEEAAKLMRAVPARDVIAPRINRKKHISPDG